ALFDEILSRHLQRRLDGFRAAGDVIDMADSGRRAADQMVGQLLGRLGGEEAGMGEGEPVRLFMHGAGHVGMAMAQAAHCRTARSIDVALALRILDVDSFAADRDRIGVVDRAMQDAAAHGILLRRLLGEKVAKASSCASELRIAPSALSPARAASRAIRVSARAKAGVMAWKKDGVVVRTSRQTAASRPIGDSLLSVSATTLVRRCRAA